MGLADITDLKNQQQMLKPVPLKLSNCTVFVQCCLGSSWVTVQGIKTAPKCNFPKGRAKTIGDGNINTAPQNWPLASLKTCSLTLFFFYSEMWIPIVLLLFRTIWWAKERCASWWNIAQTCACFLWQANKPNSPAGCTVCHSSHQPTIHKVSTSRVRWLMRGGDSVDEDPRKRRKAVNKIKYCHL